MVAGPVLFLDAARPEPIAGLWREGSLQVRDVPRNREDSRGLQLYDTLREILDAAGIDWSRLAAVAVGVGPGPMNGARVGVAAAIGLANGLGIGVIPLPAFFGYVDVRRGDAQTAIVPLGKVGHALADVTVSADGWRLDAMRVVAAAIPAPTAFDPAALARAIGDNPPLPPASVLPVYLREPDAEPQFDAFGRPLADAATRP